MGLLRPEVIGPQRPEHEQVPQLRQVLIRDFKQKVTDMAGRRLFQPVVNSPETYAYSVAEADFYGLPTRFIVAGNAYASGLDQSGRRQVTLVLIAMQKIASSSVAVIRAALRKRLERIQDEVTRFRQAPPLPDRPEADDDEDLSDALERWEQEARFKLMEDELPHLRALLGAAEAIREESKIRRIGEIIDARFAERAVLTLHRVQGDPGPGGLDPDGALWRRSRRFHQRR